MPGLEWAQLEAPVVKRVGRLRERRVVAANALPGYFLVRGDLPDLEGFIAAQAIAPDGRAMMVGDDELAAMREALALEWRRLVRAPSGADGAEPAFSPGEVVRLAVGAGPFFGANFVVVSQKPGAVILRHEKGTLPVKISPFLLEHFQA